MKAQGRSELTQILPTPPGDAGYYPHSTDEEAGNMKEFAN